MRKGMKKAKELREFSAPSFAGKKDVQESQATESKRKVWTKENLPLMEKDRNREHTGHTVVYGI